MVLPGDTPGPRRYPCCFRAICWWPLDSRGKDRPTTAPFISQIHYGKVPKMCGASDGAGGYLNKTNNFNIRTYALSLKNDPISPKNRSHIAFLVKPIVTTQTDSGGHKNISTVEREGTVHPSRRAGRNQFARRFSYFFRPLN